MPGERAVNDRPALAAVLTQHVDEAFMLRLVRSVLVRAVHSRSIACSLLMNALRHTWMACSFQALQAERCWSANWSAQAMERLSPWAW